MRGAFVGHISNTSVERSTASVTDSEPRTRRIGGPHGPSRKSIHSDQSRIAKITTLAVTIKRRGTLSRVGCAGMVILVLGRVVLMLFFAPIHRWLRYYRFYLFLWLNASLSLPLSLRSLRENGESIRLHLGHKA